MHIVQAVVVWSRCWIEQSAFCKDCTRVVEEKMPSSWCPCKGWSYTLKIIPHFIITPNPKLIVQIACILVSCTIPKGLRVFSIHQRHWNAMARVAHYTVHAAWLLYTHSEWPFRCVSWRRGMYFSPVQVVVNQLHCSQYVLQHGWCIAI